MRIRVTFSLIAECGMSTDSRRIAWALRIRVSRSAIGSVIAMVLSLASPARLHHARDLPAVRKLPKAESAELELAVGGAGTAAHAATIVGPHAVLGPPERLRYE